MRPFGTRTPEDCQPNKMRTQQHCLDPPVTGHRLTTRDGTVFCLKDKGIKNDQMFMANAPRCNGNTTEHMRSWCQSFTACAAANGKCVHPHFCFRKENIASLTGFTAGEDDDHNQCDTPGECSMTIETWSHQMHQATSHKNVFPAGMCDEQTMILNNHAGSKGCEALLALICPGHPNHSTHPTAAVRD